MADNVVYVGKELDKTGAMHTTLDPIRSYDHAIFSNKISGCHDLSGVIYTPGSGKSVYIRKIIYTSLSGITPSRFKLGALNLSGAFVAITPMIYIPVAASGTAYEYENLRTQVLDVDIGPTTVISGQKITMLSGQGAFGGDIGLVVQIDPKKME